MDPNIQAILGDPKIFGSLDRLSKAKLRRLVVKDETADTIFKHKIDLDGLSSEDLEALEGHSRERLSPLLDRGQFTTPARVGIKTRTVHMLPRSLESKREIFHDVPIHDPGTELGWIMAKETDLKEVNDDTLLLLAAPKVKTKLGTRSVLELIDPDTYERVEKEALSRAGMSQKQLGTLAVGRGLLPAADEFRALKLTDRQRKLLPITFSAFGFIEGASAMLPLVAGGVGINNAVKKLGMKQAGRLGGAAFGEGILGAVYGGVAPGILAELSGRPDNHVLNFMEAATIAASVDLGIEAARLLRGKTISEAGVVTKAFINDLEPPQSGGGLRNTARADIGGVGTEDIIVGADGKQTSQTSFIGSESQATFSSGSSSQQTAVADTGEIEIDPLVWLKNRRIDGDTFEEIAKENIAAKIGRLVNRAVTSTGKLFTEEFDQKTVMAGNIASWERRARLDNNRLDQAIKKAWGKSGAGDIETAHMNRYLETLEGANLLPPGIVSVLDDMNQTIGKLSKEMAGLDKVLSKSMIQTIDENLNHYVTRSYRLFTDNRYAKNMLQEGFKKGTPEAKIVDAAKATFIEELEGPWTDEALKRGSRRGLRGEQLLDFIEKEIDGRAEASVKEVLNVKNADPFTFSIDSVNDIVKRRKEIPQAFQDLLGREKNTKISYLRTVLSQSEFIAKSNFYNNVRDIGLEKGYLSEVPDTLRSHVIEAPENTPFHALNGLATTPDHADVLKAMDELASVKSNVWKTLIGASALVNINKTVLSHTTQIRNITGGALMMASNGRLNYNALKIADKVISDDLAITLGGKVKEASGAKIQEYAKLGLLDEGVFTSEIKKQLTDIFGHMDEVGLQEGMSGFSKRVAKAAVTAPFEVYQAVDNLMRITAFEVEKARYAKALGISPDNPELQKRMAEIVTDTYPTYSKVGKATKFLRRAPVGNFMSFASEQWRTIPNTIRLGLEEMGTPELRQIGATRLASTLLAGAVGVSAVPFVTRQFSGTTIAEEDAMRNFVHPATRNHTFTVFEDTEKPGVWGVIDLSYTDPNSQYRAPIMAALTAGLRPGASRKDVFDEIKDPYSDEKILFSKLLDASRNTTKEGREVVNPALKLAAPNEFLTQLGMSVGRELLPGSFKQLLPLKQAAFGERCKFDREFSLRGEMLNNFAGIRRRDINIADSLQKFKAADFNNIKRGSAEIFSDTARSMASNFTPEEQVESYMKANKARFVGFQRLYTSVQAAKTLRLPNNKIQRALRAGNMSTDDILATFRGSFVPLKISKAQKISLMKSGVLINWPMLEQIERDLYNANISLDPKTTFPE